MKSSAWIVAGTLLTASSMSSFAQSTPMGSGPGMQPPVQRGGAEPTPYPMTPAQQNAYTPMGSGPGMQPRVQAAPAPTPYPMTPAQQDAYTPMGSGPGMQPRAQSAQVGAAPAAGGMMERSTMSHPKRHRKHKKTM